MKAITKVTFGANKVTKKYLYVLRDLKINVIWSFITK
jgi:hypothetical protein